MYIETQFSIFMVNKPGVLSQVLSELAKEKINIVALTMMDSAEHGVLRLVAKKNHVVKVLSRLNMPYSETDVLCVTLSNKSGALAEVTKKLADAHINISYAYVTAGARGGKTTGILKVADVNKAMKVLDNGGQKRERAVGTVKRSPKKK